MSSIMEALECLAPLRARMRQGAASNETGNMLDAVFQQLEMQVAHEQQQMQLAATTAAHQHQHLQSQQGSQHQQQQPQQPQQSSRERAAATAAAVQQSIAERRINRTATG